MNAINAILAALVVLGIVDCVTTYIALKGGDEEAAPAAAFMFKLMGPVLGMIVLKVFASALLFFIILESGWWWVGVLFILGYIYVIANNVRAIRS